MKARHAPGYVPNPHYSEEDWDEVSDNPKWTEEDFAKAKPAREVLPPAFFEALARKRGQRGPQKAPTKVAISIRLSQDVIDAFKAGGPGWQARMDEALRAAVKRG
jgi:uncharacterized protein (DUF4415 family)